MSNSYSNSADILLPKSFPWGVALISKDNGDLLYANEYMQTYYFDDELQSARIEDHFVFPKGQSFADIIAELSAGAVWRGRVVPHRNRHGISSVDVLLQPETKDSSRVWLYLMEHPSIDGALSFSSRSELQILQVLLDNTLDYVFFRDTEGHFIITNKAFSLEVAGDQRASTIGHTIDAFVSRESAQWIHESDRQMYASGLPLVNKVSRFIFNNGTTHWLQMTTVPVRSASDQMIGSVSVAHDISDLKRTELDLLTAIEEVEDASRAKGEFLAIMSHEIRTPINGIIRASELCQETQLNVEQRQYVDVVVQCSHTLLDLVNDILDFSKIEAGKLTLETHSFNPIQIIEDVVHEFAQTVGQKQIELIASYDHTLPESFIGDPIRLKQIIYNLVGNAVKFTDVGEIVLRAETLNFDQGRAQLRFSVRDTGIGICESRIDSIFSSFTQADMSTTRKYDGTGLGLTICKKLVELMGGSIQVESELGKGSTFMVDLAFKYIMPATAKSNPLNQQLAHLNVLIIDDNATNRDLYQHMCHSWGCRSSITCDGSEALAMLDEACHAGDPYALMLVDQQMPGLTGLDLASLILSRPELKTTQMLLLSSSLNINEIERAEQLGITRVLSKPVKRNSLLKAILEIFDLPAKAVDTASQEIAEPLSDGLNLLLAEDNRVNQTIVRRRLEQLGHQVVIVSDGQQAVDATIASRFDCIFMDLQMPVMDGHEATRQIRRFELQQQKAPTWIVAMTAHAMKGDEETCLTNGMNAYISKPFGMARLKEVLAAAKVHTHEQNDVPDTELESLHFGFAQHLDTMNQEDREDLLSVATLLPQNLPKDMDKLKRALHEQDLQQVKFMAHTLKGVAGIFGATPIVTQGNELEAAAKAGNARTVAKRSGQFLAQLRNLIAEVEMELQKNLDH